MHYAAIHINTYFEEILVGLIEVELNVVGSDEPVT